MPKETTKDVTKEALKYLHKVYEHRSRTIAVLFVSNSEELKLKWEEAQFELGSKYQYQGENERIWDYYLALCCDFDEESLSYETRFSIENDRFCCRKIFIFNQTKLNFKIEKIIANLFPKIESPGRISVLEPNEFIVGLGASPLIKREFFTRSWNETEIHKLANMLILEASVDDKNN